MKWANRGDGKHFSCRKNIDVRYKYISQLVTAKKVTLKKVPATVMKAKVSKKSSGPKDLKREIKKLHILTRCKAISLKIL